MFYPSALLISACQLLGGGTRTGLPGDIILQMLAIPVLMIAVWRLTSHQARYLRTPLILIAGLVTLPLLQLVPLPPRVWAALPSRDAVLANLSLIGAADTWMPISISPLATWMGIASLIPPIAIFLSAAQLTTREREKIFDIVIVFAVASGVLGLFQIIQGPASPLRFFRITNRNEAVGFFANRNHAAALLYCAIPLIAARIASSMRAPSYKSGSFSLLAASAALMCLLPAILMTRSRAGLMLALFVLPAAAALVGRKPGITLIALSFLGAITFVTDVAWHRTIERVMADPFTDARMDIASTTLTAAKAFMPFGSGLGTFREAYGMFEQTDRVLPAYINRAHNEFLDLWLETGIAGLIMIALFGCWLMRRLAGIYMQKSSPDDAPGNAQTTAAALVVILLIAHSLIDYPLRTASLAALFAFSSALLASPATTTSSTDQRRRRRQGTYSAAHS